ncbi:MAG: hypothetical protein AB8B63_20125 [Granulosicoccus sp.]
MKLNSKELQRTQIFLVLQGDQAFWFKYMDERFVDSFVDRIEKDIPERPSRCPWVSEDSMQPILEVNLVLNTVLDELDHVAMESRGNSLGNSLRRRWCIRQLHKDYAQATVYPLPGNRASSVASLVHHIVPEPWSCWLTELQKRDVLVVAVATATELLCKWSESRKEPILLDMPVGEERRHLLVLDGIPLYMRIVTFSEADKNVPHIQQAVVQTQALVRESPVFSESALKVGHLIVNESSPSPEWSDARVMAALMAGSDVSFRHLRYEGDGEAVHKSTETDAVSAPVQSTRWQQVLNKVTSSLPRDWKPGQRGRQWTPMRYAWFTSDVLEMSIGRLKTLLHISQLKFATIVFCTFAVLLSAVALAYGVNGLVYREGLRAEQQQHKIKAARLMQQARSMHVAPVSVARSMVLIDDFNAENSLQPNLVTSVLATALSNVPAVSLERLVWTILNDNEHYDDIVNSNSPAVVREFYWGDELSSQVVLVEVSGFVSGLNLSDQKRAMDRFVSQLETGQFVSQVAVLESPVDSALHSELASELSSAYRISVRMVAG